MIAKNNLKIFLSFLSLVAFISCSAGDKLGSETQSSQISGEGKGGLKTNLPIWGTGHVKGNHSKSELVGTWKSDYGQNLIIDIDGNIHLYRDLSIYMHSWNYYGKTADTFDYPYTVEVVYKLNDRESQTGTITFHNASSCSASFYGRWRSMYGGWGWDKLTSTFTK